ncbi:hypothetical protein [Shewanella surugensis]|uniref:Uncharacterized protein n=1 Tax=Shewanella surugensis TaxID=212020 RepID=A0ABT0LJ69_9GAMM|nr:hypothetical protein [Shewanella surugensis]MCL1127715.1 hypothetical protein [Shewanella surugensis]
MGIVENHLNMPCFEQRKVDNYIAHTGKNYKPIFRDIDTAKFIESQFHFVTLKESQKIFEGNNSTAFGVPKKCLHIQSYDQSQYISLELRRKFVTQGFIRQMVLKYKANGGDGKYWLWDDYQRIIELSGHIE